MLAWLAKIGIGSIVSQLAAAYAARQNAQTDQERIAAEERIRALEARRDIQVAEAGSPINALVRLCFAIPPAIYMAKLFIWDKVLGWGATDPLSPTMEYVLWTVVGFYFLQWSIGRTARIIKR